MDDEHLYFYSSDTYSPSDATSFHYYKWTQLDECWSGRLAYIVMSEPEAGAGITGIRRFEADLTEAGSGSTYELGAGGTKVDLTSFTNGKMSTLGHGVLAYTIEGMATTASEESAASIGQLSRCCTLSCHFAHETALFFFNFSQNRFF